MEVALSDDLTTFGRGLDLLEAVVRADGERSLSEISDEMGLSSSTAHRFISVMMSRGFLARARAGRYIGGVSFGELSAHRANDVLARVGRPLIDEAAKRLGMTLHLGVFDGEMVTYIVKTNGPGATKAVEFTREGMQLEAYCSGVGKILLASIPREEQIRYIGDDSLVALTPKTITDKSELLDALSIIRQTGFACDDEEVKEGLRCLAVPVYGPGGRVLAALSASMDVPGDATPSDERVLSELNAAAQRISKNIGMNGELVQENAGRGSP